MKKKNQKLKIILKKILISSILYLIKEMNYT